jgi:pimeloyl-ACP methyl ester carboxylesterase
MRERTFEVIEGWGWGGRSLGLGLGPGLGLRRLPAGPEGPALELIEGRPNGPETGPPLLFVHGAFGGAWTWSEVVLPYCLRRGRRVLAVSLRGHGGSGGHRRLREWTLADYLTDVRRALAELPEPPVVVAHSLGGLLAQRLLGREPMRGLVLMGSLPPEGMFFEGPRVLATDPQIWLEAWLGSVGQVRGPITLAGLQVLFFEGLPPERVQRYASLMTPESPRALADAHWPGPILPAFLAGVPTLVLGGDSDRLVSQPSVWRTALYHGAEPHILPSMGHFLPLDTGAERAAGLVLDWIDRSFT